MKTFQELLADLDACYITRDWAAAKTIEEVVAECHRGDWLLWLAFEINVDKRKITLAKAHCANTIRHLMKDERSLNAVDVAMAYGEGRAIDKELRDAACTADAAAADAAAAYFATDATDAYFAADAAAAAYFAADADADTADAAYFADANAAANAAGSRSASRKQTADICRQYIGQAIIERVNELLNQ